MGIESLQRSGAGTSSAAAQGFGSAADLGGPIKASNPLSIKSKSRALPTAIPVNKPLVPAGKVTTTNAPLVPNKNGAAPTATVRRAVSVAVGKSTVNFGGTSKAVTSVSVTVPLASQGSNSINAVVGTNGGTSSVLGGSLKVGVFNDALKLNADFSGVAPNNGKLTGANTTSLGALVKTGASEISASVAFVNSQEAGKTATTYKLGGKVPVAKDSTLDVGASLSQVRGDSSKNSLILNAGLTTGGNQFSLQYEKSGAGVQTIQGRVGFSF